MLIDKRSFSAMLLNTADLWQTHTSFLGDIDSRFGDGDHGITIGKISRIIIENVQNWNKESIGEFIKTMGENIMAINGGSAGPLYGTLIAGLGEPLGDETEIDGELLKKMLQGSLSEISDITNAGVGDKTMMDALIPAVEAATASTGEVSEILEAAAKAAANGAEYTQSIASKFGRARSYGDQTIGTPDAGALSTSLFFQGLYEGLK